MAESWGIVSVFLRVYGFGDSTFAELLQGVEGPKGKGRTYLNGGIRGYIPKSE